MMTISFLLSTILDGSLNSTELVESESHRVLFGSYDIVIEEIIANGSNFIICIEYREQDTL